MQASIDTWEGCLKTTSGVIRLDKLFVYPISFKFDRSGAYRFERVEELDIKLTVKNENEVREELTLIKTDYGKDTLGVLLVPDGSMYNQYNIY